MTKFPESILADGFQYIGADGIAGLSFNGFGSIQHGDAVRLYAGNVELLRGVKDAESYVQFMDGIGVRIGGDFTVTKQDGFTIPKVTSAQRDALISSNQGVMVYDTDDDTVYALSGAPAGATFDDGDIKYTVVQPGNFGDQYFLYYDFTLPDNTVPVVVTIDNSATDGNFTLHIQCSQNFDNTNAQFMAAFQNNPAVTSIITPTLIGNIDSQPNYGQGNFSGGSPAWAPLNSGFVNGLTDGSVKADGSVPFTGPVNFSGQDISQIKTIQINAPVPGDGQVGLFSQEGGQQTECKFQFRSTVRTSDTTPVLLASLPVQTWIQGQDRNCFYLEIKVIVGGNNGKNGAVFHRGYHFYEDTENLGDGYRPHITLAAQQDIFVHTSEPGITLTVAPSSDQQTIEITATGTTNFYRWVMFGEMINVCVF